jgi:hypothetical protein
MKQSPRTEEHRLLSNGSGNTDLVEGEFENWWPGIGRWRLGMKMEDATIEFPEGKHWVGPRL